MRKLVLASLVVTTSLAGCATVRDSRANPFNWFGGSDAAAADVTPNTDTVNTLIPQRRSFFDRAPAPPYPGTLVQQVTELNARQVPGGAVVEVTGIFRSVASFDVRLVEVPTEDETTLSYEMRAIQPQAGEGQGTPRVRTVTAAIRLTNQQLAGITTIRVISQGNTRTTTR